PEGGLDFKNAQDSIKKICADVGKPVIVKETGAGISREIALMLEKSGVAVIDISGLGGTSFSLVESYRDKDKPPIGTAFKNWGIPTAVSIAETRKTTKLPIIASGGVRTGIDAAKAICLGADYAGLALPLLEPATKSKKEVKKVLEKIIKELKTTMFLIGAKSINELKKKDIIITGKTREWLKERGINTKDFANRETLESLRTTVKSAMYR
ncbi:MAG: alpha-hydroxy-acid oxidizing protein, partial [Candidatus Aenigmarchaeota archaeon]|nr:alpha-hydroxy-acid oxidizing protein [Candidatus Aenigmarchaeota archaeon]